MRTQDEIVKRIRERIDNDMLGFEWHEYLMYLDYEHAKEFLKPEADKARWDDSRIVPDDNELKQRAIDYMQFAWDKANGCRGISSSRSISHYIAWIWLMGEDGFDDLFDDYEFYGKPQLERIGSFLGVDTSIFDDGKRSNTEY